MKLSQSELRLRATVFAEAWKDAHYERGQTQTFYNEFFAIFDVKVRKVAYFEQQVKKLGNRQGFIDLFWPGTLLVEQKSAGRSLEAARQQAFDYFPGLKDSEHPRYILLSDFRTFELLDLETHTEVSFPLSQLPQHIERFFFIMGVETKVFRDQDPVNIIASEQMGKLHDAIKATGYEGHDLERLLVRLVFCLFADDVGIFSPRDSFTDFIENRTRADGGDLGPLLMQLFEILNTPEDKRQTNLDEELRQFPYVNGALFAERLPIPHCDSAMRKLLLEACAFDWSGISPAIFGSLFQSVMNTKERRKSGAHYTTEKNILKVIQPLFLDGLRAEFEALVKRRGRDRRDKLEEFHAKLGNLTFFDPACGCGNFLIIAYRELRQLEIELLKELHPGERQYNLDVTVLSRIDVDQFYGIEIGEFPARIAEVAMWMMDHVMNNRLSLAFGAVYARLPLKKSPHILCADALETDWQTLLPPAQCSYVFGNPPFIGAKYQSEKQRQQVRILARLPGSGGTLDYVTAWFLKAGAYVQGGTARIGFVSTNSITQGEQVAQLWPILFDRYHLEIAFAHRTFAWGSDARGMAHVHVVIIGLTQRADEPEMKRLFTYDDIKGDPAESRHKALTAYLFGADTVANRHLVVKETTRPLSPRPLISFGSMPNDNGHLILSADQRIEVLSQFPQLSDLIRPLLGAHDMLNGEERFCLWLKDADTARIRGNRFLMERIGLTKEYRLASTRKATKELANFPYLFGEIRHTEQPFVLVPRHSSETREYLPLGFFGSESIAHDSCLMIPNASTYDFGVLTSRMHMVWLRQIGGRLKSDYRYSIGLVYNTFAWPNATEAQKQKVRTLAQAVLEARANYPGATLADLYDRDLMKPDLRKAHQALDTAIDRLYRPTPFANDTDRVEHLFGLYEKLTAPLTAKIKGPRQRKSMQDAL